MTGHNMHREDWWKVMGMVMEFIVTILSTGID